MKVTSEIDLEDFKAWSEAENVLKRLVDNGHAKDMQAVLEDLYPDGIDETQLNDFLWFEAEDQYPGWFFDYSEMEEVESKVEKLNKEPRKAWFEADGGVLYYLETERETDDDPEQEPTLKLQAVAHGGNSGDIVDVQEIEYDFSESFDDNLEKLRQEMLENDILPALPSDMEYVEDFPEWAVSYFMHEGVLSEEDRNLVDEWAEDNGYEELVSVLEETRNEFNSYPAFGLACATSTVVMRKKGESNG